MYPALRDGRKRIGVGGTVSLAIYTLDICAIADGLASQVDVVCNRRSRRREIGWQTMPALGPTPRCTRKKQNYLRITPAPKPAAWYPVSGPTMSLGSPGLDTPVGARLCSRVERDPAPGPSGLSALIDGDRADAAGPRPGVRRDPNRADRGRASPSSRLLRRMSPCADRLSRCTVAPSGFTLEWAPSLQGWAHPWRRCRRRRPRRTLAAPGTPGRSRPTPRAAPYCTSGRRLRC
jgi:hypothetical protein